MSKKNSTSLTALFQCCLGVQIEICYACRTKYICVDLTLAQYLVGTRKFSYQIEMTIYVLTEGLYSEFDVL